MLSERVIERSLPIAMAFLGSLAIALAVFGTLEPAFRTPLMAGGILCLFLAISFVTRDWFREGLIPLHDRMNEVRNTLRFVLEKDREPLAGITRVYSYHREAIEEFWEHLESHGRRADLLVVSMFDPTAGISIRQLERALQQGSRIRILFLDPASPFVEALSSTDSIPRLQPELLESVELCKSLSKKNGLEFRLLREPQPFHLYFLEELAVMIPRLPLQTHRGLAIRVDRGRMFDDLQEVFDSLWLTSNRIPDSLPQRATV